MLHVHRAGRADHLVGALADVLAVPPDDPMQHDTVAVHSLGIERWLAQQLSLRLGAATGRADGICANVEFVFRRRIMDQPLALAADGDGAGDAPFQPDRDADPWSPSRLVWRLLELLEATPAGLDLGPLAPHVADRAARFGAAWRVVDLFDRYAVHRPEMLLAWLDGSSVDAVGQPLSDAHRWQAGLWMQLRALLDVPSRPERQRAAIERLRAGDLELDLPPRLSLFNLTALAAGDIELLQAIAVHRDVHLFLLHASPALWERVPALAPTARPPLRDDDPTAGLAAHPLLASWGRDTRELQLVLAAAGTTSSRAYGSPPLEGPSPDVTLLRRLHADIHADRRPPGAPVGDRADQRAVLPADDRSVQVHSCHGRTRQVEVLRDAIGHLLAADPQLQPRDIVVLCPDVEQFAPLVHAVFGAEAVTSDRDDGELPQLRVRIADRSLRESNPLMEVVAGVLELIDGRVEASRVLDLAGREPVRRRFRLDDDDLARLEAWTDDVGVRWGFDAEHRAAHDLAGIAANTWRSGLDRLLAGVAVPDQDHRTFAGVVPYDVEGDDVDRVGRLAELLARLHTIVDELGHPQPIDAWCDGIRRAVDLLSVVPDRDAWQRHQLERELDEVVGSATATDGTVAPIPLELAEVRTLFADRLRGKPSRANHRTGDLTVCTLVPMRSVPHRVVCLLGMDDMAFPRTTQVDGDSLLDAAPRVGDRDPRTEDRQLLLDAVLAATDALVITYTGRNERTNEPEPPSVPIGELLDTIDATVVPADPQAARARDAVVVEHPLQGFDPRNFEPGRLGVPGVWGFERTDLAGARALRAPRAPVGRFVPEPLERLDEPIVGLDDLTGFLGHPVRAFLSRRLGVRVPRDQDERDDAIPVEAAPLVRYSIGQRRLDAALHEVDPARWEAVERARGELPPGNLADPVLAEVHETVAALVAAAAGEGAVAGSGPAPGSTVEIDVPLPGGRALVGTVRGVHGDVVSALRYARLGPRHHLEAYVQLVALSAAQPDRAWRAVAVGRNPRKAKAKAAWCRLGPLGASSDERRAAAMDALEILLDLYDRGTTEPLPLYCKTSAAYADAVSGGKPNRYAAAGTWDDEYGFPENADPEHVVVLGSAATYESLLLEPPSQLECGPGWADVASRFEALALRLWRPIAACREEGTA